MWDADAGRHGVTESSDVSAGTPRLMRVCLCGPAKDHASFAIFLRKPFLMDHLHRSRKSLGNLQTVRLKLSLRRFSLPLLKIQARPVFPVAWAPSHLYPQVPIIS